MFCLAGDRDDVVQFCCFRSVSSWGLIVHEGFLTHLKPLTKVAGILPGCFCSSVTHRNRCWHSDVASPPQGCHTFPRALDFHVACSMSLGGFGRVSLSPEPCQGHSWHMALSWVCSSAHTEWERTVNGAGGEMAKTGPEGSLCSRAGHWELADPTCCSHTSVWVAVLVLIHVHIPWEGGTELWQMCHGQNLKMRKAEKLGREGQGVDLSQSSMTRSQPFSPAIRWHLHAPCLHSCGVCHHRDLSWCMVTLQKGEKHFIPKHLIPASSSKSPGQSFLNMGRIEGMVGTWLLMPCCCGRGEFPKMAHPPSFSNSVLANLFLWSH